MIATATALTAIVFVNPVPWARAQMAFTLGFHIILVPLCGETLTPVEEVAVPVDCS